jgi:hypothetical protein
VLDYFYNTQDRVADVFEGKQLSVNIDNLLPGSENITGLQDLKTKLEILCR